MRLRIFQHAVLSMWRNERKGQIDAISLETPSSPQH